MTKAPDRHTPLTVKPIDEDSGDALLTEYDREGAQLATEALARVQNELRMTPSRTRAQRRRRTELIEQAHAQKAYLDALAVKVQLHVDDRPERARAERRRVRRRTWIRRSRSATAVTLGVTVIAVLGSIGVLAITTINNPAKEGQKSREVLEVIARNELRYAARNNDTFTETIKKLRDIERETNGSNSHAYNLLYSDGDDYNIIAQDGQFNVVRTKAPYFSLRRNADGTFAASCRASEAYGCKNRTWTPSGELPMPPR